VEGRPLHGIMLPAVVLTYAFGGMVAAVPGAVDWRRGWIWAKLALVVVLTVLHLLLAQWRRKFAAGENPHSERFYRVINELPTVILIAIIMLVIVRPF